MLAQVDDPLSDDASINAGSLLLKEQKVGKKQFDCILLTPRQSPAGGVYPSACFEPGKTLLWINSDQLASMCLRNVIGTFQGQTVAVDLVESLAGVVLASVHIAQLNALSPDPAAFTVTPDLETHKQIRTVSSALAGKIVTNVPPHYPESAKEKHRQGVVVLRVKIGPDGHVHDVRAIASPGGDDFAKAAQEAVSHWVYEPYLVNGKPVEVETLVSVNFHIGFN